MSAENFNLNSMEALLAASIDDIADLPSFKAPPTGNYQLKLKVEPKIIANKPALEFSYEILEIRELANSEDTPPNVGDKCSEAYFLNEIGLGKLKQLVSGEAGLWVSLGATNWAEFVAAANDIIVNGTLKRVPDKDDSEKFYTRAANLMLA